MNAYAAKEHHKTDRVHWYHELLSTTPCVECHQSYPASFMTFRYEDPDAPLDGAPHNLATRGYSKGRINAELNKGYIVCTWHALEIDYLRKALDLTRQFNRDWKAELARLAEDIERKVRVEMGAGLSLADVIHQHLERTNE